MTWWCMNWELYNTILVWGYQKKSILIWVIGTCQINSFCSAYELLSVMLFGRGIKVLKLNRKLKRFCENFNILWWISQEMYENKYVCNEMYEQFTYLQNDSQNCNLMAKIFETCLFQFDNYQPLRSGSLYGQCCVRVSFPSASERAFALLRCRKCDLRWELMPGSLKSRHVHDPRAV